MSAVGNATTNASAPVVAPKYGVATAPGDDDPCMKCQKNASHCDKAWPGPPAGPGRFCYIYNDPSLSKDSLPCCCPDTPTSCVTLVNPSDCFCVMPVTPPPTKTDGPHKTTKAPPSTSIPPSPTDNDGVDLGVVLGVSVAVLAVGLAGGVWWWRRRKHENPDYFDYPTMKEI
ncbi:Aste57867_11202 [Aphanomyces stellatus]|uniref:Aste57867_11202 protein n=1 Tax=Aphanomyces stellatus TaxID=120398 RepID=A0A485KSC4_9STRA|nr:hypothetical protein As57867_011160 [Aphanomyces stellatus]VFT88069.1 Aste57867_11202 [Aphanomyces stellatus]